MLLFIASCRDFLDWGSVSLWLPDEGRFAYVVKWSELELGELMGYAELTLCFEWLLTCGDCGFLSYSLGLSMDICHSQNIVLCVHIDKHSQSRISDSRATVRFCQSSLCLMGFPPFTEGRMGWDMPILFLIKFCFKFLDCYPRLFVVWKWKERCCVAVIFDNQSTRRQMPFKVFTAHYRL